MTDELERIFVPAGKTFHRIDGSILATAIKDIEVGPTITHSILEGFDLHGTVIPKPNPGEFIAEPFGELYYLMKRECSLPNCPRET